MDLRCADCGGNVWRSETTHRPGRDGRMLTIHKFVCDCCAEREFADCMRATSIEEVSKIIASKRNNDSIASKISQDMTAIADLQRQLEAEREAHCVTRRHAEQINKERIAALEAADAERADHEATKKWLRRAHNLLGGIAK